MMMSAPVNFFTPQEVKSNRFGNFKGFLSILEDIEVSFPSKREAEIAYQVLVVDKEPPRSQVSKLLNLENKRLKIQFTAPAPRQLKIGVNGFLDHLMLVCETMVHFGLPDSS